MKYSTIYEALNASLSEAMARDYSILAVGSDVRGYENALSAGLYKSYGGERVIDIPFSEDMGCGVALGLAQTGARPVLQIDGEYLLRAIDTIANEIAPTDFMYDSQYASSMVIIAYTGFVKNASPQKNQAYEAMFCQIPSLKVLTLSNPDDAYCSLNRALENDSPSLILIDRELLKKDFNDSGVSVSSGTDSGELLKAKTLLEGEDVSIITYGAMTGECVAAAKKAKAEKDINCDVIELTELSEPDKEAINASVIKTGKAIIAHKARLTAGIGAEIAALIAEGDAFDYLEAPIKRVCAKDRFIGYGDEYYCESVPCENDVYAAILEMSE